jgi:hypothetical protein
MAPDLVCRTQLLPQVSPRFSAPEWHAPLAPTENPVIQRDCCGESQSLAGDNEEVVWKYQAGRGS